MDYPITKHATRDCSDLLLEISNPPEYLYTRGVLPPRGTKCLAVVGSRNYSNYGKQVVEYFIEGLRGYPVAIISGLALGIDGLAHETALRAGLYTLAVPGSGLDDSVLYPARHKSLARKILESGGGLLSEYEPAFAATTWSFPQRNRIMAGLSHAVLLIEASEKSGTLITARLTAEYNRELLVVPGNIFSENSKGVHQFLKLGATPITTPEDVLEALNVKKDENKETELLAANLSESERAILSILTEPRDQDTIIRLTSRSSEEVLMLLMQLELSGHIREINGTFFKK